MEQAESDLFARLERIEGRGLASRWRSKLGASTWAVTALCAAVAVGGLTVLGIEIDRSLLASTRRSVRSLLETTLQTEKAAITIWAQGHMRLAETIAEDPRARDGILEIAALPAAEVDLRGPALVSALGKNLSRELGRHGYVSVLVVRPDARTLRLSVPDGKVLSYSVALSRLAAAQAALDGQTGLSPPIRPRDFARTRASALEELPPTMYVTVPVSRGGETVAAILLAMPSSADFTHVLQMARLGDSGETYAIDVHGRLISETRFPAELAKLGLLGPVPSGQSASAGALNLVLRDPGVDLTEGEVPALPAAERPLTRPVLAATNGGSGVDVIGYRDYRGIPSVGAWTWLPSMGIGLVTELNHEEAYARHRTLRGGFWFIYVLLGASVIGLLGYTVVVLVLRRRVADAQALGQYHLGQKLGEGGMGSVYRAQHALLARPAAIKMLDGASASPERVARFEREVRTTAKLTHPNTVSVYDFGRTPSGTFYYAMELLDGINLEQLVEHEGPLPPARAVHFLEQICGSLAEAHALGLIHRDIKPANVMVTHQGGISDFVKVLDFGLVRAIAHQNVRLTASQNIAGTPLYMSPEQATDDQNIGPASDLYQVGALAYFLLTGREPFRAATYFEVLHHHVRTPPEPPSKHLDTPLPADLEDLVLECLEKSPERRPASALVLRERLEQLSIPRWTRAEAARASAQTPRSGKIPVGRPTALEATVVLRS